MAKRKRKALPGCDLRVKEGPANPRDRRHTHQPAEDPRKVALAARCRVAGLASNRDARTQASAPWYGHDLGLVMQHERTRTETARLWAVFAAYSAAIAVYRARYLGTTGNPQGAAIAMLPDHVAADVSHTVDTRTSAEKDADCVRSYMRWQGYLRTLSNADATAIIQAEHGNGPLLWQDQAPTVAGYRALEAIERLAELVG
jgi:hypothetical protein